MKLKAALLVGMLEVAAWLLPCAPVELLEVVLEVVPCAPVVLLEVRTLATFELLELVKSACSVEVGACPPR